MIEYDVREGGVRADLKILASVTGKIELSFIGMVEIVRGTLFGGGLR